MSWSSLRNRMVLVRVSEPRAFLHHAAKTTGQLRRESREVILPKSVDGDHYDKRWSLVAAACGRFLGAGTYRRSSYQNGEVSEHGVNLLMPGMDSNIGEIHNESDIGAQSTRASVAL